LFKTKLTFVLFLVTLLSVGVWLSGGLYPFPVLASNPEPSTTFKGYTGSVSCRECHEKFYKLWAPSHHGMAMQPYTDEFARTQLTPQNKDIIIGQYRYRAEIATNKGWVLEQGPESKKKFRIESVLGGKNVYYFLTQSLP